MKKNLPSMKENYGAPTRRHFLLTGLSAAALARVAFAGDEDEKDGQCPATGADIEGPYYRPDAPMRTDLSKDDAGGTLLIVSGIVKSGPDCAPLKSAIVDVWQANHDGHYDNEDEAHEAKGFMLRGRMTTNEAGAYEFSTVVPGCYQIGGGKFRPAHIHYKVSCPGFSGLTTQLYFKGDPYLKTDPWAKADRAVELQKHDQDAEAKKRGLSKPFFTCTFDIALRKARKLSYGD